MLQVSTINLRPEFFLLVDLRDFFFSDLGSGGRKKINKKALKMTRVIFTAFFFKYLQKKNSKTSKVNQQSVFYHFPKTLDSFFSVTLKNAQTEPQKYIIIFNETNSIKSRRIK